MKSVLRFLGFVLLALLGLAMVAGALFGYFVYAPDPELPHLTGTLRLDRNGRIEADLPDLFAEGAAERRAAGAGDAWLR